MARSTVLSKAPEILVFDARPSGSGPIKQLDCWAFDSKVKGILYYERIGWVPIEEVMLKAFLGQRYRVARDAADDFIEDGVPLELVLKPEGNGKGWDSLAVLQRKHRG